METGGIQRPELPALAGSSEAQLERARRAAASGDAGDAARQFETLLATMLVRELRRAIPDGIFGQGAGADVYEGWFDEHLGRALGERDALGIGAMIKSSLARKQASIEAAGGGA